MVGPPAGEPHRSGLIGGVVGRLAPAVMRQIDTNDLVDALDVVVIAADRKILLKWGEAFRARAGVRGGAPLGA